MALQPNAAPASRQPQAFGVKEQRPDGLEPKISSLAHMTFPFGGRHAALGWGARPAEI